MNEQNKPKTTNGIANSSDHPSEVVPNERVPTITNIAPPFKPKARGTIQEALHPVVSDDAMKRPNPQTLEKEALNRRLWAGVTSQRKNPYKK